MNKIIQSLIFLSALLLALPAFAEGHLRIVNETHNSIDVQCGHDGHAGQAYGVHPDHSTSMNIHGHGEIHCVAKNNHGHRIASRAFHYDHGDESYKWYVRAH